MPKIVINEKDLTSNPYINPMECVVYIAGLPGQDKPSATTGKPILCKTVKEFEEEFGTTPHFDQETVEEVTVTTYDKAYISAHRLLELGLYVLYEVPTGATTVATLETAVTTTGFYDKLVDRGLYNLRYIYSAGYVTVENSAIVKEIMAVVAERGDATYLVDCRESYDSNVVTNILTDFNAVVGQGNNSDAKYSAGFAPWCTFTVDIGSSTTNMTLPGSFAYLEAFATSINYYPQWNAAAGAVRGQIRDIVSTTIDFGELDIDLLQKRTANNIAVNTIANINPYGIIVWGNRTLHRTVGESSEDGLVASSFLNIRQLVNIIKKTIFQTARRLTFEQNTDILWVNFKSYITPTLDAMSGSGIKSYRLAKDTSAKRAELKAILRIVPIEAVEDFDITIELADSLEIVTE